MRLVQPPPEGGTEPSRGCGGRELPLAGAGLGLAWSGLRQGCVGLGREALWG